MPPSRPSILLLVVLPVVSVIYTQLKMNAKSIYAGDASSIYATNTMFPKDIALQDDLKFDVAAPAGWEYAPGDTIIGHLMRKSPLVTPECTVIVWLAGRRIRGDPVNLT